MSSLSANLHDRACERGSALVSAIALAAVFAGLAILSIQVALNSAFLSRELVRDVETDALLRSAFSEALWQLQEPQSRFDFNTPVEVGVQGRSVVVEFFSPSGLVDINSASPSVMRPVLAAAGAEDPTALAAAIADWRDGDDLVAVNGAEAAAYQSVGVPTPGNRPFAHEGELLSVLGMTPAVFACLQDRITVSSHAPVPDLSRADDWLRRAFGGEVSTSRTPVTMGTGDLLGMRLTVQDGAERTTRATVLARFSGDIRDPVWIQAWDVSHAEPASCAVAS